MKERIIITAASLVGAAVSSFVTRKVVNSRNAKFYRELDKQLESIENNILKELEGGRVI